MTDVKFNSWNDYPLVRNLPTDLRKRAKGLLSALPDSHTLRLIAHWPTLRTWRKAHATDQVPVYKDRDALFEAVIEPRLEPEIIYMEFGCASGEFVQRWAAINKNPAAQFIGFDTFTGMPEEWSGLGWSVPKGAWSQNGIIPEVEDARVSFVAGQFQDSLEPYLAQTGLLASQKHFVLYIDADLYSATLFVLVVMRPVLGRATVFFDEFDCVLDEMKALDDFCRAFDLKYEVLGTAVSCEKVAIRFIGRDG